MNLWVDAIKMVALSSASTLVLCVLLIALLGVSERSFLLFTPMPRWPILLAMTALWCISLKAAYWWVFQRYTFYSGK